MKVPSEIKSKSARNSVNSKKKSEGAKASHKISSKHKRINSKPVSKMKTKSELTEKQKQLIKQIAEKTEQLKEIESLLSSKK